MTAGILLFFGGVGVIVYPHISNKINDDKMKTVVNDFDTHISEMYNTTDTDDIQNEIDRIIAENPDTDYNIEDYIADHDISLTEAEQKKVTDAVYTEIEYRYLVGNKPLFKVRGKGEYGDDDIAGIVDETGKEILPCKYDKSEFRVDENRGLIFTRKKKKEGVFDLEGKAIVKCAYRPCKLLEDVNVFAGYTSKDVTLFNNLGQIIIDKEQYDKIKSFSKDGLLHIRSIDSKWWYIDLWGNKKQE